MRLPILVATLFAVSVGGFAGPADAGKRKVAVPNKFDGNWSIEVVTEDGPCDRAYRYGIKVYRGEAIYPGGDVSIRGRVSKAGAVSGVIARGSDSAQVTGRLTTGGSGGGSWGSTGNGPIGCSGRWTAVRRG
ncbi:hypothetical protein [Methylobacterium haplocladii]|uniref:Large exoprotein involved in heme utilization or adhesion n=1 Tax=Methylobacterium haplocladii TaxID=1176176 RepID=A0A512IR26_9HYPH|nr:hypothetical protein [Methylobacterium haplocladii]GEP00123.1 hypothetical protein MHA02_25100 [Methylobacterium haplocladii]GJD85374.1 hypothetical protein HPGCJGGD_3263 [Methylobacterium haplocladii]GLS58171.1 hypothetical protein GCM10007887_08270 [Methylobacterium haplocladii]